MSATSFGPLHELLMEERELLLAGKLNEIAELAETKSRLLEKLGTSTGADFLSLKGISDLAKANSRLFEAASAGLRDARKRLRGGQGGAGFRTYSGNGQVSQSIEHIPFLERSL